MHQRVLWAVAQCRPAYVVRTAPPLWRLRPGTGQWLSPTRADLTWRAPMCPVPRPQPLTLPPAAVWPGSSPAPPPRPPPGERGGHLVPDGQHPRPPCTQAPPRRPTSPWPAWRAPPPAAPCQARGRPRPPPDAGGATAHPACRAPCLVGCSTARRAAEPSARSLRSFFAGRNICSRRGARATASPIAGSLPPRQAPERTRSAMPFHNARTDRTRRVRVFSIFVVTARDRATVSGAHRPRDSACPRRFGGPAPRARPARRAPHRPQVRGAHRPDQHGERGGDLSGYSVRPFCTGPRARQQPGRFGEHARRVATCGRRLAGNQADRAQGAAEARDAGHHD